MIVIISRFILMPFHCRFYLRFYIYKAAKAKKVTKVSSRESSGGRILYNTFSRRHRML